MRPRVFVSILLCFYFITTNIQAQSKIYFSSKSEAVEFTDISSEGVTYFTSSGSSVTKEISKVVIVFNARGAFLVPSKLDFNDQKIKDLVSTFANNKSESSTTDQVYKSDFTILKVNVNSEKKDKDYLFLQDGTVLQKKAVVAVIYKDGRHEILGPVEKAAETMWLASDIAEKAKVAKGAATAKVTTASPEVKKDIEPQTANKAVIDSVKTQVNAVVKNIDTVSKKQPDPVAKTTSPITPYDTLNPDVKENFKKQAKYKVEQFTDLVKIIMTEEGDRVDKAIEECVALFIADARIEVSSLNVSTVSYPIREYLNHIKGLPYTKIEVKWTNISYVSDIHLAENKKYYGTISFEQTFTAYVDEKVAYSDVTQKNAEVALEIRKRVNNGVNEMTWEIFLGNIYVEKTRENK
jgi:hypothetical protein